MKHFFSNSHSHLLQFFLLIFLIACNSEQETALFHRIPATQSGIEFNNTITENETLNILDYEYLYNGGGIGVGDFNQDGLPDLFFAGNMVSSRLYLNQGDLTFKDISKSAGVTTDAWCTGVAVVDINQDGLPDIHVATAHDINLETATNYFFINKTQPNGEVKFENLAFEMGVADSSYSIQAAFLDYDKDSDLDLFLINNSMEVYPRNSPLGQKKNGTGKSTDRLYRNDGLSKEGIPIFTDVSQTAGILIEGWSLGVVTMDINHDTYPDVYVANDFLSNDLLYVNNGDGTFTNQIEHYFKHQSHNSMGIDAADINNDGSLDLLVLDMLPEDNLRHKTMFGEIPFDRFRQSLQRNYQPQYVRNVLQLNNGDGSFSDIAHYAGVAATDWSWSPLIADFDNDGKRDIYITNGYKKDITDLDFVNYNNGSNLFGTAAEKRVKLVEQLNKMEGVKKTNRFFENQNGLQFKDHTKNIGLFYPSYSNGAVYVDLDVDGDLDLVTNNLNDPAFLFENTATQNYFNLRLEPDHLAYGSQIWLKSNGQTQYAVFYPQKGYLSSQSPTLHFGLDSLSSIDTLKIIWPDQRVTFLTNITANQLLTITANQSKPSLTPQKQPTRPLLNIAEVSPIAYRHTESSFDDFKKWPLHFRSYSSNGPVLAAGDINGDGSEDLFVGGTARQHGQFFLQRIDGSFESIELADSTNEDVAATLFDADKDGDLDLYCVSGSSEFYAQPKQYQDRLYMNDGVGNFELSVDALPTIPIAGSCATPIDFDQDGDLDIFVGGRIDANNYPASPKSYLLQNNGGQFKAVTSVIAPQLEQAGMITDAIAEDLDRDGWTDLMVIGEWMPIQIYYNRAGRLTLATSKGLEKTNGWWNTMEAADFDKDGDLDFVLGNWGLNNPFSASPEQPLSIYTKDYDRNGATEAIFTYYNQAKEYVYHPRGTLTKQLPTITNIVPDYRTYGLSTFKEIFAAYNFTKKEVFRTHQLASVYVENLGNQQFEVHSLPAEAQWFPIFDLEVADINGDGHLDILATGNSTDNEILSGWYDASNGLVLIGDGTGNFQSARQAGFKVDGIGRSIQKLRYKKQEFFIIGIQQDSLQFMSRNRSRLEG